MSASFQISEGPVTGRYGLRRTAASWRIDDVLRHQLVDASARGVMRRKQAITDAPLPPELPRMARGKAVALAWYGVGFVLLFAAAMAQVGPSGGGGGSLGGAALGTTRYCCSCPASRCWSPPAS